MQPAQREGQFGSKQPGLGGDAEDCGPLGSSGGVAVCRESELRQWPLVWWLPFIGWDSLQHRAGVFGILMPGRCGHR